MFLLSNIDDREYRKVFPEIPNVLFDLSEEQIKNAKNRAWLEINPGCLVCVVPSSRKMGAIACVDARIPSEVVEVSRGRLHVITGRIIARIPGDPTMSVILKRYNVTNPYLPRHVFTPGFNVADLGSALDSLMVKTSMGVQSLQDLKGFAHRCGVQGPKSA